jgi:hypothetical protein
VSEITGPRYGLFVRFGLQLGPNIARLLYDASCKDFAVNAPFTTS